MRKADYLLRTVLKCDSGCEELSELDAISRIVSLSRAYKTTDEQYLYHGPIWDEKHWSRVLNREELKTFSWNPEWGSTITRKLILDEWSSAHNEVSAVHSFFLTMAWGFGAHFRGPWKMAAMFDSMLEKPFGEYLLKVKDLVEQSNSDAFRALLEQKIKQLGPVYSSKLLYAMSAKTLRSPVMDMWIERWGRLPEIGLKFSVSSTRSIHENVTELERFTKFCYLALQRVNSINPNLVAESENDVGFVEYLIFWDSKYRGRKPWQKAFPLWVQHDMLK